MKEPLWMWVLFLGIIIGLLILDLGFFHKKDKKMSVKESFMMSIFYFMVALLFGGWIWYQLGSGSAADYLTGYLVEKSLSLDNIFLMSLVFSHFSIPVKYQHRVLFWGVLGVIIFRGLMIGLGAKLVSEFEWIFYVFAVFLIITGIKMLFINSNAPSLDQSHLLTFLETYLPYSNKLEGHKFFIRKKDPMTKKKKTYFTPLMVSLIIIEIIDLVFALDSIPAIFSITTDPYIVYTSNIFAILGLRSLYFALADIVHRFYYLKYAIALILIFIGSKVFVKKLFGMHEFPASISLVVIVSLLGGGVLYSIYRTKQSKL